MVPCCCGTQYRRGGHGAGTSEAAAHQDHVEGLTPIATGTAATLLRKGSVKDAIGLSRNRHPATVVPGPNEVGRIANCRRALPGRITDVPVPRPTRGRQRAADKERANLLLDETCEGGVDVLRAS